MPKRQPALPLLWLVSDARNDALLEPALARLPRGSGLIFRHYHLPEPDRRDRFARLAQTARRRGHRVVLSGDPRTAKRWRADGVYGAAPRLAPGPAVPRFVAAHSLREIAEAHRGRADAVLLSPAFRTRSHPDQRALGPVRFRLLAARARVPVIALGGMDARKAGRLCWRRWAAIDGLSRPICTAPPTRRS